MQEITKFKNGKIAFRVDRKNGYYFDVNKQLDERYYHDVMNMSDLYFNQINGYMYLVDFNTGLAYDLEIYPGTWSLTKFLSNVDRLNRNRKAYYLKPFGKRYSKSLLQDLENGY